jgi:5'-AMP-activated protein kinase catalytic alpha subunit
VKKGRLPEDEASFFFYQIINGVDYIFSKGVAHRDLKPENLLLTKDSEIKIIDFGLSNYYNGEKDLETPCGSPCYASPEMVSGNKYNGFNIDIWATGIILFAMVCGYLPFENPDNDKLFEQILKAELDFPEHVSEVCKNIIKKILVTNPKKRITIDQIKKHEFYLMGKENYDIIINRNKNKSKIKFKKHNSDNYLTNINIKYINNKNEENNIKKDNNKNDIELKTINNAKEKINLFKKNNFDKLNKEKKYILSNRVGKYKINGFKINKGFSNYIKNESTEKGLITEANIHTNKNIKINGNNDFNQLYINTNKNSNRKNGNKILFLNQKINIPKLKGTKKLPLKFNLTELTNNYINTKIFSKIKNSKRNKSNQNKIYLINSMNNKTKPLIIDNALINININSNKYIIDNININNNIIERSTTSHNKKIKSKSPGILRFHNFKRKNYQNVNEDQLEFIKNNNKKKVIISNGLRLKTDYNNNRDVECIESNLKTLQNILYNKEKDKDKTKFNFNNKLKFNKIYNFFH